MSSEESDPPPLSTLSQKLERDTFIFSSAFPTRLIFGLNQKVTRASSCDIHRWAHLRTIGPTIEWPSTAPPPDFLLRPVKFYSLGILSYLIKPNGDSIPETSKDPLFEGNYGYFFPDGEKISPGIGGNNPKNEVPKGLSVEIQNICKSRCTITGETEDTFVSWIFPPAYAHLADRDPSESGEYQPDTYRRKANLFVVRKDIFAEYWRNTFSFDPADNYRTVIFREMPAAMRAILPNCLNIEALSPDAGKYIAMHFNYTLVVNILYGDIGEEFS